MTLPDPIDLWASALQYASNGLPTKSALTGARLAEGYVPLEHAVAAQEANEYLHRLGTAIEDHRATLTHLYTELTGRVPGASLPGGGLQETTVALPVIPLVGDWEYFAANPASPADPFGVRVMADIVTFGATLCAEGYLKELTVFVVGQGAEPADVDKPSLTVTYGDVQGGVDGFAPAGYEADIQNTSLDWVDTTPLLFTPTTRPSLVRPLSLSLNLASGTGVNFIVAAITAVITPTA